LPSFHCPAALWILDRFPGFFTISRQGVNDTAVVRTILQMAAPAWLIRAAAAEAVLRTPMMKELCLLS